MARYYCMICGTGFEKLHDWDGEDEKSNLTCSLKHYEELQRIKENAYREHKDWITMIHQKARQEGAEGNAG